jgi:superfamily II DNA/RNA helicase
LCRQIM